MRMMVVALVAGAIALSACSTSGASSGPRGWKQAADGSWASPLNPRQSFRVTSSPFDGTLKDLASQTTTDVILQRQVKYRGGVPFSRCPGEAGLQSFASASAGIVVEAAFSVQNGKRTLAEYTRPATEKDDPAAIDAMAANVCVVP